jgi:hypothetical protein
MDANITKIILAIIAGVFAVGLAITITIKVIKNRSSNSYRSGNDVKQKDIRAGGDVGAGDIIKGNNNFQ